MEAFIEELCRERRAFRVTPGSRERCERAVREVLAFLFPHHAPASAGRPSCEHAAVRAELAGLRRSLHAALEQLPREADGAGDRVAATVEHVLARLPEIHARLLEDAQALVDGDPAARSVDEVILSYPGFLAMSFHRIAHELYLRDEELAARLIAELAHRETGIDVHPGATIGRAFAVDHGTGVVIGETAVIGDRVKVYQGVTLGAASVSKAEARRKRHPTVGDDVVIYASATILGGDTVVGAGSVIGGNVWLTHSVPPGSVVTHEATTTRVRMRGEDPALEFHI